MPLERSSDLGLIARQPEYVPIKAFAAGGFYWDAGPQTLIREYLGAFLPAASRGKDDRGEFGSFRTVQKGRDPLTKSRSLKNTKIPSGQLKELKESVARFKALAQAEGTIADYRSLISKFQLPDPAKEPDLYRWTGNFWNKRLQILWGCEKSRDSSLPLETAINTFTPDRAYGISRAVSLIALLLLLALLLAAILRTAPAIKEWATGLFNKPPVAALNLDFVDETNKTAAVSDAGSKDPDGKLTAWRLGWGDGKEDQFGQAPKQVSHTYAEDGDYTISLWCTDNHNATSAPPATVQAKIHHNQQLADAEQKHPEEASTEQQRQQDKAEQKHEDALTDGKVKEAQDGASKDSGIADSKSEDTNDIAKLKENDHQDLTPRDASSNSLPQSADTASPPLGPDVAQTPPQPTAQSQPESSDGTPSRSETPKGAQILMYRSLEIIKAGVGGPTSGQTLEVMLVVRDRAHPNTPLDVLDWIVDGKAYRSGNAQFTTTLGRDDHTVEVRVRHTGIEQTVKAKLRITGATTNTAPADFTVTPFE